MVVQFRLARYPRSGAMRDGSRKARSSFTWALNPSARVHEVSVVLERQFGPHPVLRARSTGGAASRGSSDLTRYFVHEVPATTAIASIEVGTAGCHSRRGARERQLASKPYFVHNEPGAKVPRAREVARRAGTSCAKYRGRLERNSDLSRYYVHDVPGAPREAARK